MTATSELKQQQQQQLVSSGPRGSNKMRELFCTITDATLQECATGAARVLVRNIPALLVRFVYVFVLFIYLRTAPRSCRAPSCSRRSTATESARPSGAEEVCEESLQRGTAEPLASPSSVSVCVRGCACVCVRPASGALAFDAGARTIREVQLGLKRDFWVSRSPPR